MSKPKFADASQEKKIAFFTTDPEIYDTFEGIYDVYKNQALLEEAKRRGMTGENITRLTNELARKKSDKIRPGLKGTIMEVAFHHKESDIVCFRWFGREVYTFGAYLSLQKSVKARVEGNLTSLKSNPEVLISVNAHFDAGTNEPIPDALADRVERSTLRRLKDNELVEVVDLSEDIAKLKLPNNEFGYCLGYKLKAFEKDQ